jgi:hypothetical protein
MRDVGPTCTTGIRKTELAKRSLTRSRRWGCAWSMRFRSWSPPMVRRAPSNAHKPGGGPGLWSTESDPLGILVLKPFEANQPSAEPLSATNGSMPVAASALLSTSRLSRAPAPNRSLTIGAQKGASRQLHRRDRELRRRQPRGNRCTGPFRSSRRVPLFHHTMCNRGGWVMARRSSLWRAIFSAACHRHCNERETA